jgi:pantetheine-phosphate adenylyltransferase
MHAVYPGTFDPFTAGHLDVADRARRLFARLTVLVAVNPAKHPELAMRSRVAAVRAVLPAHWSNVEVEAWAGLTAAFCRASAADVLVRGVRNKADLLDEYQLAAMNEALGVTTLLLPSRPDLASISSTLIRHGPDPA